MGFFFFFFFCCTQTCPAGHGPKSQTQKSIQTQNHKPQNIHVTNPNINKNNHSIFFPSKWIPRSNKPICTKNPTNPRNCKPKNKISKSENPTNKTQKKTQQIWFVSGLGFGMICW